jgi:hypothetical protein
MIKFLYFVQVAGASGAAMVMTDIFQKNCYSMGNIIFKIMKKFEKLEHIEIQGVTFGQKTSGCWLSRYLTSYKSGYNNCFL